MKEDEARISNLLRDTRDVQKCKKRRGQPVQYL